MFFDSVTQAGFEMVKTTPLILNIEKDKAAFQTYHFVNHSMFWNIPEEIPTILPEANYFNQWQEIPDILSSLRTKLLQLVLSVNLSPKTTVPVAEPSIQCTTAAGTVGLPAMGI